MKELEEIYKERIPAEMRTLTSAIRGLGDVVADTPTNREFVDHNRAFDYSAEISRSATKVRSTMYSVLPKNKDLFLINEIKGLGIQFLCRDISPKEAAEIIVEVKKNAAKLQTLIDNL